MEENAPTASAPELEAKADLKPLRMLAHATALSLLILTGTVFVFLYRQVISLRRSSAELGNYIVDYQNSNAPEFIAEIHRKFAEFRRQNPDFAPVYSRYFGTNEPPPKALPSTITPAPPR